MRVLVAGATGVIGRKLVPLLSSVGHEVTGLVRSSRRAAEVKEALPEIVIADALDRSAVARAVREAAPDAVVHMLTAIPADISPRHFARDFGQTNRLRTEGTRNLLEAANAVGVRRMVAQSVAFAYDPDGTGTANEDMPLWRTPPKPFAPALAAIRDLEGQVANAGGLVLRLGHLYGPGSAYAYDGSFAQQVRQGKVPLVGGGTSTFSFVHAQDAASAVVAALDTDAAGVLNVVDDDPAPMHVWVPWLADLLGARQPRPAPAALARLAVGGWAVAFMTRLRGADNARAKLTLDWRPRYASWREGLADELKSASSA